jgi:hypothetical protein
VWELRLQPAVAGAKQSFNTPGRQCLGGKEAGWVGQGGGKRVAKGNHRKVKVLFLLALRATWAC